MKMSMNYADKSSKLSLLAAVCGLIAAAAFLVYGLVYSVYFDLAVLIFLLLAVVGYVSHGKVKGLVGDLLPLLSVIFGGIGLNIFFLNSYTVWADWYGNFNMYGSQGGIAPVAAIMAITGLSILLGIIVCFTRKKEEAN